MTCRKVNMEFRERSANKLFIKLLIFCMYTHFVATAKLLCADTECKGIIAEGRTVNMYPSPRPEILSLSPNKNLKIYGRLIDDEKYYLTAIGGRRGFAPTRFIEETKILNRNLVEVPSEKFGWKTISNKAKDKYETIPEEKTPISSDPKNDDIVLQGSTVSSSTLFSKSNIPDDALSKSPEATAKEEENFKESLSDETITVEDLNRYSIVNNKISEIQNEIPSNSEQKTSTSDNGPQINNAHQELNIHSSTVAGNAESFHSHISPSPSISDLNSGRSLLSTKEVQESCTLIEGTHICEENPTSPSESNSINEQTPSIVDAYNSPHLHPSTLTSELSTISNDAQTPHSSDSHIIETEISEMHPSLNNPVLSSDILDQSKLVQQDSIEKNLYATPSISVENKQESTLIDNAVSSVFVENKQESTVANDHNSQEILESNKESVSSTNLDEVNIEKETEEVSITDSNDIKNKMVSDSLKPSENTDSSNNLESDTLVNTNSKSLDIEDTNINFVTNNSNNQSIFSKVVTFAKNVFSTIGSEKPKSELDMDNEENNFENENKHDIDDTDNEEEEEEDEDLEEEENLIDNGDDDDETNENIQALNDLNMLKPEIKQVDENGIKEINPSENAIDKTNEQIRSNVDIKEIKSDGKDILADVHKTNLNSNSNQDNVFQKDEDDTVTNKDSVLHKESIEISHVKKIENSKTALSEEISDTATIANVNEDSSKIATNINNDLESNKKLELDSNMNKKTIDEKNMKEIKEKDVKIHSKPELEQNVTNDENLIADKKEINSKIIDSLEEPSIPAKNNDLSDIKVNIPVENSESASNEDLNQNIPVETEDKQNIIMKESTVSESKPSLESSLNLNDVDNKLDSKISNSVPSDQENSKLLKESDEIKFLSKNTDDENLNDKFQDTVFISESPLTSSTEMIGNSDESALNKDINFNLDAGNESQDLLAKSIELSNNPKITDDYSLKNDYNQLSVKDESIQSDTKEHLHNVDIDMKKNIETVKDEILPYDEDGMITASRIETTTRSILNYNEEVDYENVEDATQSAFDVINEEAKEYIGFLPFFLQVIIDMLPGQIQKQFSEWEIQGLSPRVTVITFITGVLTTFVCIFTVYIQRKSKESYLIGKLGAIEQKMFTVKTERDILKEELDTTKHQFGVLQKNLIDQRNITTPLQKELDETKNQNNELQSSVETLSYQLEMLQKNVTSLQSLAQTREEKNVELMQKLEENEKLNAEMEQNLEQLHLELSNEKEINENLKLTNEDLSTKLNQLETNCKQLLQEAQVWNERVNELTNLLEVSKQNCEELQSAVACKETELEGIKSSIKEIKILEETINESDEGNEKLQKLFDVSLAQEQFREMKEEKSALLEKYTVVNEELHCIEKQLSESKEEIEKLKMNYNQALQDKMEAQTKLDVLSNYFKEKELQLQKELGVQEAMRQQKEEVASSASQHIALVEQENISYKNQLATLKQELEDTERNYKNQVATHEKKAHENWLAARFVERKLEEAKQESAQLRQRLTLLEREQENWTKSQIDGVVRPVPKRYLDPNGEVPFASKPNISQQLDSVEMSNSSVPRLPSHDMLELNKMPSTENPMLLPVDRPLPPPPPMMKFMDPRFPLPPLPPFLPHPPPFNERLPPPPPAPPSYLDPWRFPPPPVPPMHRRMSPPDFDRSRLSATPQDSMSPPPYDREMDKHSITSRDTVDRHLLSDRSSPPMHRDPSSRDSHNSSPPRMLPRFHDNPPPNPYGGYPPPPPIMSSRFPSSSLRRRDPPNFPLNVPLDQRSVDHRGGDPVTSSPRHFRERTPPNTKSNTTAV
ncbi:transport and Golgi organization protein 1 isoform X2 [Centruroides vittatus]|uniref:transport and Golgi organization protein 1 isoform X2 n=1 Tax=Centruroides vittatus TaxID=120091 RepID=UPI0035109B26